MIWLRGGKRADRDGLQGADGPYGPESSEVAEKTFAKLNHSRGLSKDNEVTIISPAFGA